jgi:hypothetical protein
MTHLKARFSSVALISKTWILAGTISNSLSFNRSLSSSLALFKIIYYTAWMSLVVLK